MRRQVADLGAGDLPEEPVVIPVSFDGVEQPVYVGFGSMVIEDEAKLNNLMRAVCSAAAAAKVRVIMQSSWAKFDPALCSDRVFVLSDRVPHHWLFERCSAVGPPFSLFL